jgi:taurine dioxygenase
MHVQRPLDEGIGVEITDFDLAKVTPDEVSELRDLVYRHKLLVFRGQRMDEERYLAMARRFGRPQIYFQAHYHHPDHPEIFVSSNVPKDGKKVGVAGTGRFWHTDYSFFDEPLSTTFVYPQIIPKSGKRETYYIDMERVYRELPEGLRTRIEGTRSFHEVTWYYKVQPSDIDRAIIDLVRQIRAEAPGAVHPTVIRHPITGARFLYVSEGFTTRVEGLDYETSGALLDELFAFIGQERFIHVHPWQEGDVLYWDNRGLLHRASEIRSGEPSMSYRIGVYDGLPFYALEGARDHAAV